MSEQPSEEFAEIYGEMCNIIDKALGEVSGFAIDPAIPSTSPQARACATKIIELLQQHGIDLEEIADLEQRVENLEELSKK